MKLESIKKIHEGKFLTYYVARYITKEGHIKDYELISRDKNLTLEKFGNNLPAGVGMVTFSSDKKKILLQKEFRMATNNWVYNFPAGLIDQGESVEEAAKREVREETGCEIKEIEVVLPPSYASQGTSDEMMSIVICTVEGEIKDSIYEEEEIEAKWYTKQEVDKLIKEGAFMSVRTQMFLYLWVKER